MSKSRKHVLESALSSFPVPSDEQHIVQAVSIPGSNQVQVVFPNGDKLLCLVPAKFRKKIWIKRGDFLIVRPVASPTNPLTPSNTNANTNTDTDTNSNANTTTDTPPTIITITAAAAAATTPTTTTTTNNKKPRSKTNHKNSGTTSADTTANTNATKNKKYQPRASQKSFGTSNADSKILAIVEFILYPHQIKNIKQLNLWPPEFANRDDNKADKKSQLMAPEKGDKDNNNGSEEEEDVLFENQNRPLFASEEEPEDDDEQDDAAADDDDDDDDDV